MTGYYDRPVSPLGDWSRFMARLSAMVFLLSGLAHRYGLIETTGFFWVLGFVFLVAFSAVVLALLAFRRTLGAGARGGRAAIGGLLLAVVVLAPFAVSAWRTVALPAVSDVSTDRDNPPAFFMAPGLRKQGQNALGRPAEADLLAAAEAYPAAIGRRYDASPDRVLRAVTNVIEASGWTVLARSGVPEETAEILIEAHAWSPVFAFPADIVVRISDKDEASWVDMRSASLYGKHDLGDNARRIQSFMKALDDEMLALAGT
ncbi:hypothetical protein CSC94_11470 [Zhengella mangrovi]|uniref:DUF1499 domain-containing protein n=1 Tax=Zhengella mangrovi TaxID=1982044 RepID=A0A2G1QNQ7_9HYPH|nr:DUF1499 domain-containing protein [Zhengella mangrovi]PHP67153.1 hypothetical protein CSC94_11470 [Zhengella mangrovi]